MPCAWIGFSNAPKIVVPTFAHRHPVCNMLRLDVQDPKLAEHLARWGIDIMKLEKTDKTMAELEVGSPIWIDMPIRW